MFLAYKSDTLSCYTDKELDAVTKQAVRTIELDTLLKIANVRLSECQDRERYLITQNTEYEGIRLNDAQIIRGKESMITERDTVISQKNEEIDSLNTEVKKQKVLKWLGTGIFISTTIYFIFH